MKGMLFGIAVLLLLVFAAPNSQAQCQYCGNSWWTGQVACLDTNYNAYCQCIPHNDYFPSCDQEDPCEGVLGTGPCGSKGPGCNVEYTEDLRGPNVPYRSGEWKVVSVTLTRKPNEGTSL
jgi:hypothetical protein